MLKFNFINFLKNHFNLINLENMRIFKLLIGRANQINKTIKYILEIAKNIELYVYYENKKLLIVIQHDVSTENKCINCFEYYSKP